METVALCVVDDQAKRRQCQCFIKRFKSSLRDFKLDIGGYISHFLVFYSAGFLCDVVSVDLT